MAVAGLDALTEEPAAAADPPADPPSGQADGPERPSWGVMARRVSGLVLCVVVPVQLALTHVFEDPARVTTREALHRWDEPGWRVLDCLVILAGAVHIATATSQGLARSTRLSPGLRVAAASVVTAGCAVAAVFATLLVATTPWS